METYYYCAEVNRAIHKAIETHIYIERERETFIQIKTFIAFIAFIAFIGAFISFIAFIAFIGAVVRARGEQRGAM